MDPLIFARYHAGPSNPHFVKMVQDHDRETQAHFDQEMKSWTEGVVVLTLVLSETGRWLWDCIAWTPENFNELRSVNINPYSVPHWDRAGNSLLLLSPALHPVCNKCI